MATEETTAAQGQNFIDDRKIDVYKDLDPAIRIRTKKMLMWFIIFAVVMLFAGLTSALIVLYGKLIWLHLTPPAELWTSNVLIILSSLTLIGSLAAIKKGSQKLGLALHVVTLFLGIGFAVSQHAAWKKMSGNGLGYTITQNEQGLDAYRWNTLGKVKGEYGKDFWFEMGNEKLVLENNEYYKPSDPSKPVTNTVMTTFNAFGALISILIYIHVFHLLFGLAYLAFNTYRISKGRINSTNTLSITVNGMYWHFLGLLWLYLFWFLFFVF